MICFETAKFFIQIKFLRYLIKNDQKYYFNYLYTSKFISIIKIKFYMMIRRIVGP